MFRNGLQPVDKMIDWEIFPKQAGVVEGSKGNLVKGPGGYHHKSEQFSKFIDVVDPKAIQYADVAKYASVNSSHNTVLKRCMAIRTIWDKALETGTMSHMDKAAADCLDWAWEKGKNTEVAGGVLINDDNELICSPTTTGSRDRVVFNAPAEFMAMWHTHTNIRPLSRKDKLSAQLDAYGRPFYLRQSNGRISVYECNVRTCATRQVR